MPQSFHLVIQHVSRPSWQPGNILFQWHEHCLELTFLALEIGTSREFEHKGCPVHICQETTKTASDSLGCSPCFEFTEVL